MGPRTLLGVVLIAAGTVLALLFADLEFLWFTGRPLGIVLIVVGVFELLESRWRARRTLAPEAGERSADRSKR